MTVGHQAVTLVPIVKATPYLYFKGRCEEALRFYATCGLGEIKELGRYGGTPMAARHGEAWQGKVLKGGTRKREGRQKDQEDQEVL